MSNRVHQSSLNFEEDEFTNYKKEEFRPIEECYNLEFYSFYCYTLARWGISSYYYLLRISDIEIIDGVNFIFVCPAYKKDDSDFDMGKRKTVLTEPNRLGLTPGKLSIELPDVEIKLDHTNSVYDPKKKRRVPITEFKSEERKSTKEKIPVERKKIDDEMVNNKDTKFEGKLHSSHFLPPAICTRLWVLSRGSNVAWGWFLKTADGFKNKFEYYCRPMDIEDLSNDYYSQYNRGGDFFTFAYLKSEFPDLDIPELSQDSFIALSKQFEDKKVESIQVVIDAMLCKL